MERQINDFFMAHTMAELYEGAIARGIPIYPMNTVREVIEDKQLHERDFWVEVDHGKTGMKIKYPGAFAKFSETPLKKPVRAPGIGEHNSDIYHKEMGFSSEHLVMLKQAGII
jgi:crotonobetainyl-CoA:carnitine CoA-transferase CaiB-like acyl-CoA transferase